MTRPSTLFPLRGRLLTISRRELSDRTLTPGEADQLLAITEAAREVLDYENQPSRTALSRLRKALNV